MNVDEAKQAKLKLQTDMLELIRAFERSTGLLIVDLDIVYTRYISEDRPRTEGVSVTVKLP